LWKILKKKLPEQPLAGAFHRHTAAGSSALASRWTRRVSVVVGRYLSVIIRPSVVDHLSIVQSVERQPSEHPSIERRASER